ncbi:hypothetical protein RB213_008120, partial [Colletotrichum asianum]
HLICCLVVPQLFTRWHREQLTVFLSSALTVVNTPRQAGQNKQTLLQLLNDQLRDEDTRIEDAMSLLQDDLKPQHDVADDSLGEKDLQYGEGFPGFEDSLVREPSELQQLIMAGEELLSETARRGQFLSHPVFWAVIGIGLQVWLAS